MTAPAVGEHVELHEVLADLVRDHGAQHVAALVVRARRRLRDARLAAQLVEETVEAVTTLVLLPDGRVEHLGRVLDGMVLTHRVRAPLGGRSDLWLGCGVQPFLTLACLHPLPLSSGGTARISESGAPALVGPPGWLPEADRGDLVGLRWCDGRLAVTRVEPADLAGPPEEQHVRALVGGRLVEQVSYGLQPDNVAALVVHCLAQARLEDPGLLSTPHAPLEEMLPEPLAGPPAASSVSPAGMVARARELGLTGDQFVALLGHLAGHGPLAGDREPWASWPPDPPARPRLTLLRGGASGPRDHPGSPGPPEAS